MSTYAMQFNGRELATDEEGFLLDPSDWSPELAQRIADDLGIQMTDAHWEIVHYVRDHFDNQFAVPELRTLLKYLKEKYGQEKATRKYVYSLFPYGYGQQPCKIAGMRKPRKLMLDV